MKIKIINQINYFLTRDIESFSSIMVIAIGLTIIMVFGLASPDFIHDAAHDVRHAMTFKILITDTHKVIYRSVVL